MHIALFGLALSTCLVCPQSGAGVIYKCIDNGKISYADRPCASGQSSTITIPAAPDASAYQATMARQARAAALLDKQHARQEAADARAQAKARERGERTSAALAKKCAILRLNQQWASEDLGAASGKQAAAASLKARRAAEKLALECPA